MAHYWAGEPQSDTDDMVRQMKAFHCTQAQIDDYLRQAEPDDCEVLAENWEALKWFLDVDDLFRFTRYSVIGLDIQAIQADAQMSQRQFTPEDYDKLRFLGREAASQLNSLGSRRK